jgi:nitrogen fixation protein NifZ
MESESIFKRNQKVRVKKIVKNDGTCFGCKRGNMMADVGDVGYVNDVTEFMYAPVVVVHFMERDFKVGMREKELELLEDYNDETGEWIAVC